MKPNVVATLITVLGAVTAALAFLPYGWAHIVAGSLAAALAALHPASAGIARMAARKGTNASAS